MPGSPPESAAAISALLCRLNSEESGSRRSVDASTRGDLADFTNSEFFAGGYYEVKELEQPSG
ncbi:MAG: hypothetical protein DMF61_01930 [Blastocatellia bacterium AA13]|nr:MAG: hypothetical protein DMF61_01930 [Blastocatellia bacterium AA13]